MPLETWDWRTPFKSTCHRSQHVELNSEQNKIQDHLNVCAAFHLVDARLTEALVRVGGVVSINVVTLRRARLVLEWVTVYKRVNHLGM